MTFHRLPKFPPSPPSPDSPSPSPVSSPDPIHDLICRFVHGLRLPPDHLALLREAIRKHHTHRVDPDQCCSLVVQRIRSPIDLVWRLVSRFDKPQVYKHFIKSCSMNGDGRVGSTREVELVSGLPAVSSTERLEILDEEQHILSFRIVGGEHRLRNYHSITTLHEFELDGNLFTIVIESYVVNVPEGNTVEDTKTFADTIIKYNLRSLACISEHQAACAKVESL